MLKITAPFKEKKEVLSLIESGADELYCGYLSPEWVKKYTSLEFERKGGGSNFTDLSELRQAVDLAHKKNTPVFLALNGLYVRQQYPLLLKIARQLGQIDLDGYIVADIGLLLTLLRKKGFRKQMHVSTGGTVFNSEAVNFYKDLGVKRIVLDRQTTLESMRGLSCDNPEIDFEVFILNTLCVYIDGFCTFMHSYGRDAEDISRKEWGDNQSLHLSTAYDPEALSDACCLKYSVQTFDSAGHKLNTDKIMPTFYKHLSDAVECGACAIYDINKTKVKSLKIVGRQLDAQIRLKSVRFVHSVLDILENNKDINRHDFIRKAQEIYQKSFEYKARCRGNNCYHPEAIYKR